MDATRGRLIQICDELFEKGIIGKGSLRDRKYDICNGFIECRVKSNNPNTYKLIRNKFENLGYTVKSGGYDYIHIYWNDEQNISILNDVFNKYE